MADEPLYITFEFRGNLAEEVERVKLGIAGLRNESAQTYQRLIADSNEAFAAMSRGNQQLAVSIQEDINSLRQLDAANKALDEGFARGTITATQYAEGKAKLAIQEADLRNGIQENIKVLQESIDQERMAEGSIESLRASLQKMEEAWRKMSAAEREGTAGQELKAKIESLKEELKGLESGTNGAASGLQQFQSQLESCPGPIGQTAAAIGKMTKAALAFIATPLGMVLAAIAAGLAAVTSWFHRTEEGENALANATAAFNQVLASLLDVVDKVGEWLYKAFTKPKEALTDLVDFIEGQVVNRITSVGKAAQAVWKMLQGDIKEGAADFANAWLQGLTGIEDAGRKASAWMAESNEKIKESVELQKRRNALDVAERDLLVERSRLEARIGELRDKAYDMNSPEAERSKALKEAIRLTDELFAKEQAIAREKYEIIKKQNSLANSNKADLRAEAEALAEVNRLEAQRYASRRMMLRQNNTLDGKLLKTNEMEDGPLGSIRYYENVIKKLKEAHALATDDPSRERINQEIEKNVKELERISERVGQVALEASKDIIENALSASERLDTSDLDRLRKKIEEVTTRTQEAREGILGLLDAWGTLNDSGRATAIADECFKIADGLSLAAETAELFNESLGSTLSTVAQLVGGVGDIAGGVGRALSGDVIGGATGILSGVTGIIGSFKKRTEENKRILAEYKQSLLETEMKELEYNAILRERLRLQQQIGETSLDYFNRQSVELKKQASQIEKEYQEVFEKLQKEQYVTETHYKHGTWFRKAKIWNDYDSLAGKTYEEMESLYTQGKLTESAQTLFEQLRKLKEEGADVADLIDDLNEEMKEAFTGTTVDSITDSIIRGFAEGKRSAKDFADDFQEMLNNAVLQGVKMKALEEPLRRWYESFAEASQNGLNADTIASLREQYNKIIEDAAKQLEDMEKVTGTTIGNIADTGRTATAQGVASMSQDSANELNGNFYALLIYADKTCQGVTNINTMMVEALGVLNRIAANTDRLEAIEKNVRETRVFIQDMANRGIILRKTA
ncbi:hypothetical protein [Parabacteroides johnsonii]|uniref:hypothetical protein n=1 Tax=Parabacteroides johnsonii TaxID=387661 RepID=UPI0011DC74E3|nr:hypothetical protein [Parabacteroides johnsonii]